MIFVPCVFDGYLDRCAPAICLEQYHTEWDPTDPCSTCSSHLIWDGNEAQIARNYEYIFPSIWAETQYRLGSLNNVDLCIGTHETSQGVRPEHAAITADKQTGDVGPL